MALPYAHGRWWCCTGMAALFLVAWLAGSPTVAGQEPAPPSPASAAAEPTPAQVRELLGLLTDPAVRTWIERTATAQPAAMALPGEPEDAGLHAFLKRRLAAVRVNIQALVGAAPQVPAEIARAGAMLEREMVTQGPVRILMLIGVFAGLGFGVLWAFWRLSARWRQRFLESPLDTVDERLRTVFQRLLYGMLMVAAFALGSLGAFLALPWPRLLQEIVTAGLFVVLAVLVANVIGRFLLAPGAPRFRVLPMPQASAEHWFFWLRVITGYAAAELVAFGLLRSLGVSTPVAGLAMLAWGLGGLALMLVALLTRPAHREGRPKARLRTRLIAVWLCVALIARTVGAFPLFVILITCVALPAALIATKRAVAHLLRPPGSETSSGEPPGLMAAGLERGLQAALTVTAFWIVARTFGLGMEMLSGGGSTMARLAGNALNAVIILLVADLAWHLVRSWIDRRLYGASAGSPVGPHDGEGGGQASLLSPEEARRRARLLTLLPIIRNVGFVVLAVMAVLMALSALGVQIGPLLAGAGVVGVAVGFGAQTVVKDIISGMFYLLDDAFRVGEYIMSGSYKGTVESFSLRSVKLRHHRGPLTTVPFGELGAVQNLSRDWVIDKINVGVTYDTDLDKVKRIVKQVSKEIMADPELAPNIIEPLKSQGVYQMGDFAIQIRMKVMTKPGEQFIVRRAIYAKIKKAFEANGIKFAVPTVTVAGGEAAGATPAAAQQALAMTQRPAAE
jgi:moderate conductance mechanosensitive channel